MRKYLSLVKLLFVQQYRVKPTEGKKKRGGTIAALVIIGLCFLPMLIGIAVATFYLGKISKGDVGVASLIIFISQGLVVLFGIQSLISNVFSAKDADKLLFLPVRPATIFSAKLTVVYINEVITTVVALMFSLLPFGIGANASFGFYLVFLPALVLIPMLPLLVGCIVAIPLSLLIAKLGKNGVVKTVLQIFMFLLIMGGYMFLSYKLGMFGKSYGEDASNADIAEIIYNNLSGLSEKMKYVHSNYTLAQAMLATSFGGVLLSLLISLSENALLFGLTLVAAVPVYRYVLSVSLEGVGAKRRKPTAQSSDKYVQVKKRGVIKELIVTDLKRVTRDSQIGFQSLLGLIMLPIMVVIFYIAFAMGGSDESGSIIEVLGSLPLYQIIAPLAIMAYMTLLGITSNVLGNYPISRENKAVYIVKSLPVSFNKILLAKVIFATAVMLISDFLTCLLTVILFGVAWYYGFAMLITMALLGFGGMCITTLIDLKSPKLGWTNFNQSLKNAKNSWLAMLLGLCVSLVVGAAASGFVVWYSLSEAWYVSLIMWLVIIGVSAVFALVCYKILTANAAKHFEKIEP